MFAASKTASVSGGYQISRSLRFNSADSAYLNRTPASAGSRTTWTWSAWVKRSSLSAYNFLFNAVSGNSETEIIFTNNDTLQFLVYNSGATAGSLNTTQVFRDVSAWYHICVAYDSTNATSGERMRIYLNGSRITAFSGETYPAQNTQGLINSTISHTLGTYTPTQFFFNGYMTEVNFIDGQALTPSSFGETNAQTGVWQPKAYSGSYGTNGFYLNFSDNSNTTAATLGKDYSGNGNNWTPNNFSVTAGAGNDSLVDSPTSYGTDTGVGGEVRGNYSTMNPLDNYNTNAAVAFTFSNGNLDVSRSNQSWASSRSTMAMSSGKWYAEMTVTASTAGTLNAMFGIAKPDFTINDYFGGQSGGYGYNAANGQKYNGGSGASYGATFTTNDVIGVAYDADAGSLVFYKNGTSQGTAYTGLSGTFCFAIGLFPQTSGSITATLNCGQRPFAYTAPSGYKALCTQNLPTPTIGATTATQANKYFNVVLRNGAGSAGGTFSTTVNMANGALLWDKTRNLGGDNLLTDSVRGISKYLVSNSTGAEGTDVNYVTAFGTNSYTVGSSDWPTDRTVVDWMWAANGSGSTNTAGSITSTVSANTTSGFSVVTYTGTGANATVGHGLGAVPKMMIVKGRSTAYNWRVYHVSTGNDGCTFLNTTAAYSSNSAIWNTTTPTSTVFSIGTDVGVNESASTNVAYVFAEVAGYSKFGSYTGNGSSDGVFVYCGFRPAFFLAKNITDGGNWNLYDNTRGPYNLDTPFLIPNSSAAEYTGGIDLVSNGVKIRTDDSPAGSNINQSGKTYIFAAFASVPLKFSLAR